MVMKVLVATASIALMTAPAAHAEVAFTCVVNANNVIYHTGPGPDYTRLGQVHRGQVLTWRAGDGGTDGHYWIKGDLRGGRAGVWIRGDFLNCSQ